MSHVERTLSATTVPLTPVGWFIRLVGSKFIGRRPGSVASFAGISNPLEHRFKLHLETTRYQAPTTSNTIITFYYVLLHMPVDFENYQPTDLPDEDTNGRRILEFLAANPETGYRAGELAAELEIPRGSVGTTLSRLESRGLVRHKGQYWAINPEAYDAHTASVIGLQTVAEQFEGDYYDQNPDWDADLPDLDEQAADDESSEER